jgi:hypothetical protein
MIFAVAAVATATSGVTGLALHDLSPASPDFYVVCGFIGLYVVGFFSASERVQQIIVLVNAAVIVVGYAPLIYTPFGA